MACVLSLCPDDEPCSCGDGTRVRYRDGAVVSIGPLPCLEVHPDGSVTVRGPHARALLDAWLGAVTE